MTGSNQSLQTKLISPSIIIQTSLISISDRSDQCYFVHSKNEKIDAENGHVVHPGFDTENLTVSHLFRSRKPVSLSLSQRSLGK